MKYKTLYGLQREQAVGLENMDLELHLFTGYTNGAITSDGAWDATAFVECDADGYAAEPMMGIDWTYDDTVSNDYPVSIALQPQKDFTFNDVSVETGDRFTTLGYFVTETGGPTNNVLWAEIFTNPVPEGTATISVHPSDDMMAIPEPD